jgi:rRNA maturation endonuclease Nob1
MSQAEFYKEQTFKLINEKLDNLQQGQIALQKEVSEIKDKVNRIYWIAGAIGVGVSLVWSIVKEKVSKYIALL